MSHLFVSMIPDPDNSLRREGELYLMLLMSFLTLLASNLEKDIVQQLDLVRNYEDPHESLLSGKHPYFSNMALTAEPVSPRQLPMEDRRPSLHSLPPRPTAFRTPAPATQHTMQMPPRRYGSIGTANPTPNYIRPLHTQTQIPHQPSQHPLSVVQEPGGPNMGRRHTSADIRVPGWPPHNHDSPMTSGDSSAHWPSSPIHAPISGDQHIREQLASYELGAPRKSFSSRQTTPPSSSDTAPSTMSMESHWSNPNPFGGGPKFQPRHLDSAPPTRRSSMASNVHSLLNPAETVERDEEDVGHDGKRKRMQ